MLEIKEPKRRVTKYPIIMVAAIRIVMNSIERTNININFAYKMTKRTNTVVATPKAICFTGFVSRILLGNTIKDKFLLVLNKIVAR